MNGSGIPVYRGVPVKVADLRPGLYVLRGYVDMVRHNAWLSHQAHRGLFWQYMLSIRRERSFDPLYYVISVCSK